MEAALETALSDKQRATDQLGEAQARQLQHHAVLQQQQQRSHHSGLQLNEYSSNIQTAGLVSPVWGQQHVATQDSKVSELEGLRAQLVVAQEELESMRASVLRERAARAVAGVPSACGVRWG